MAEDEMFPGFVNYTVAKMVAPYTRDMKPTEVRSATNAAIQAIKEAMAALKTIEEVTARVMRATCDPALLGPKKTQPKPKKGEPYPLHPRPDEAMRNVAKEFAEVIGLEKKRVAAYQNHIKTAKKRKKKLAVPAASMPLSELKGNQVIRTILEMSDQLRPVLDKIGIGPNSKKEQLEELEEDPIFKSLRSMSAEMKRSAFGENGLDGLNGLGGDDEDDESGGAGEAGKSEFIPPPEPPQEQSHGQYQYPQHPRQNGAAGMYPHPLDLYTDQNQNQVQHRPMGTNGHWYPNQYPMIPNYPPHPMMMHPPHPMMMHPHQQMMGPLEQKTGLLFGFFDKQGPVVKVGKVLLFAAGIFVVYMILCAFFTHVVEGTWYLCGAYEQIMTYFFANADKQDKWKSKLSQLQAIRIASKKLDETISINDKTEKQNLIRELVKAMKGQVDKTGDNESHSILTAALAADKAPKELFATRVLEVKGVSDAMKKLNIDLKHVRPQIQAAVQITDADTLASDSMLMMLSWAGIHETTQESMIAFFVAVVSTMLFWFFGARKRFYLAPVLTLALGYTMTSDPTDEKSDFENIRKFASEHAVITLTLVTAILTAITNYTSGASATDAVSGALGTMSVSLRDEADRRMKLHQINQMQIAQVESSVPFLAARYVGNYVPWFAEEAKKFVGKKG